MEYNLCDKDIMGSDKTFLKRQSNGMMLSDEDVDILKNNGIDYLACHSLSELIFMIDERLAEEENDILENLCIKLSEYQYYHYTNK